MEPRKRKVLFLNAEDTDWYGVLGIDLFYFDGHGRHASEGVTYMQVIPSTL